jgi:hypothetical protein
MASLEQVVPYAHQDDGHANYNTVEIGFIPVGICIRAPADTWNKTARNVFKACTPEAIALGICLLI